ncbi:MAG: T9SS type A sorting domain-containing protein [Chitinophagales bacterium]|nr:T9SS type A sorting domain-containing protein [Chitinophagales bacterium]
MKNLFICLISLLTFQQVLAQHNHAHLSTSTSPHEHTPCRATLSPEDAGTYWNTYGAAFQTFYEENKNAIVQGRMPVMYVPVQIHIVRQDDGSGGADLDDIMVEFEDFVRPYYVPTNLDFTFCNEPNFINSSQFYSLSGDAEGDLMSTTHNVANMLNVYYVSDPDGACGWARFTTDATDYIVIANSCSDNQSTTAHEIGHYFDLFHTHETAFGNELVDGTNCGTTGDLLCDTPADPNLSGEVNASCVYTGNATDGNGDPYNPDPTNIMSYSRKACRTFFSPEQIAKIIFTSLNGRSYLDYNCTPYNDQCADAITIDCGVSQYGNTVHATSSNAPSGCANGGIPGTGVWFHVVGDGNQWTVDTDGSNYDTQINVYEGSCGSLTCVGGDDDSGPGSTSSLDFCTEQGTNYYIYLDGFAATGSYVLNSSCAASAPVLSCPPITVYTDPGVCTYTSTGNELTPSVSDDCPDVTLENNRNNTSSLSGELFVLGNTIITWTATDAGGNTDNCFQTITVEDNENPVAVCLDNTVYLMPDGTYTLQESDVFDAINSSDNCGIDNVSFPATVYDCDDAMMTFQVTVTIEDAAGNQDDCISNITVEIGDALPAPWIGSDIGNSGLGNDYEFDPCANWPNPEDGEFTITAGGNNAFPAGTTDNMAFINQGYCGDVQIIAKLESVTPNGYGGLVIRETNDANAKQVSLFTNLSNTLRWETRYLTGSNKVVQAHYRPFPVWLKLIRQGDWFFGYYSTNGFTYSYVHAVYVPMNNCIRIGMAGFTYMVNQQAEAVFSFVEVGPVMGMPYAIDTPHIPADQDKIGASVFPNPASDMINLHIGEASASTTQLVIRNELGQVIEQQSLAAGTLSLQWDISAYKNGLYFIEIRKEDATLQSLRFVKSE